MKFALRKGWVILLFVLPFCVSCGDADLLDTNKWSDQIDGWNPSIKGAIAWGGFTVWDFLQDSTREDFRIEVEEDSSLVVKYSQKDIVNIDVAEIFKLGETPINFRTNLESPLSVVGEFLSSEEGRVIRSKEIAQKLPLPDDVTDMELHYMTLSKATCRLVGLEDVLYKKIVILHQADEKVEGNENISKWDTLTTIKANGAPEKLEDKTFYINAHSHEIYLKVVVYLDEVEAIPANLSVEVTLSDYDFSKVQGKIVKTIPIDDNFDMDMDMLNDIHGTIKFADPKVELVMRNKGLGIPFEVDMKFSGTNTDSVLTLYKPLAFNGELSVDTVISRVIDNTNSNIVNFLAELPRGKMNYVGTVAVNPGLGRDPQKKYNCVIYKEGSLGLDLNVVVPVEFDTSSHLSYSKSLTDLNLSLDQQYTDKIKEGTIVLHVQENALPLDLSIPKMVLQYESDVPRDTIFVEHGGKILAGKGGELSFKIDETVAKKLGQMKGIELEAVVSGGTGKPLRANDRLKFFLRLEASAEIKDINDFK